MDRKYKNCDPVIYDNNSLLSGDNMFMHKQFIKESCDCIHKATCIRIIELLDTHKNDEAYTLLHSLKDDHEIQRRHFNK